MSLESRLNRLEGRGEAADGFVRFNVGVPIEALSREEWARAFAQQQRAAARVGVHIFTVRLDRPGASGFDVGGED